MEPGKKRHFLLMLSIKRTWLILIVLPVAFFMAGQNLNKDEIDYKLRVGVSDDTSSLAITHMLLNGYSGEIQLEDFMEKYSVTDC